MLVSERARRQRLQALPPYPAPEAREDLLLVLGEQHRRASVERASEPRWLVIPERGLYTGIAIVGAIAHPLRMNVNALWTSALALQG